MARLRTVTCIAVALASAMVGCSRERVPLPGADATPEDVVRADVMAVNADDCDRMSALSDPSHSVRAWCGGIDVMSLRFGRPFPDGCCGHSEAFAHAVNVPVTFHLKGADSSMPDGEHAWGYILVRNDDREPWRVLDEGVG